MLDTLKSITIADFEDVTQLFNEVEERFGEQLPDELEVARGALDLLQKAIVEAQTFVDDLEGTSEFALTAAGQKAAFYASLEASAP